MRRALVANVLLIWCALGPPRALLAQETVNLASISGRVFDPQGAAVPDAQVTARHTETNVTAETMTDREGRFRFAYLKVGPYELTIRRSGFSDLTGRLTLTVGAAFDLPLSLAVDALTTSIVVNGQAPLLESARSQLAGTVSQTEVRDVPLNGRNFLDLALLVPGVTPTNTGSTQPFAETSAVPGQGVSIGSQRNFSNNFIVDGLSANDDAAGLSGMAYGVDAVDQLQVVTSGGQAELGRALGGYISVVTKSGTNVSRGDLYGYFRDARFNSPNALSKTTLPMSQRQYGASAGGPLVQNRTFYFANVEQRTLHGSGVVTIAPTTVEIINARLSDVGYPGSALTTGVYPSPVGATTVLGKVDHQISGTDQMAVRYSLYRVRATNSRGAGGTSAPSASAALGDNDHAVAFANTLTLSASTVNETRAQIGYGSLGALPADAVGPSVTIQGVATFGTLSGSPTQRMNTMVQVVDNLSHQAGAHALRVGVDMLYNADRIVFPRAIRGGYTFSSLTSFLSGVYNNAGFTQTFGETSVTQANPNVGFYIQDEWKLRAPVTLNAGVRYDLQWLETITTDRNNLAPRIGLAWSPSASGSTVVRGSAGVFFDRVPLRAVANTLLSAGNTTNLSAIRQLNVVLSPGQSGSPLFPHILSEAVPLVTLASYTTMQRDMQNAFSRQMSVEVERRLGKAGTYSAGYQYVRGVDLIMSINQNVPSCVAVGANNGCRPNSGYANDARYSAAGSSSYHGLHVSVVQRPSKWGYYRVAYTYSKSMDDVGASFFSSPIDPFDLSKDWARSDSDQRHRLVANGALVSPVDPARTPGERLWYGFQASGALQYYSAPPFNITSGVTTVHGTAGRPVVDARFIDRNAGTGGDFLTANLRISRAFRVTGKLRAEAIAEVFNATNHRNDLARIGNFGPGTYPTNPAPTFNQITAVGDPRTWQFAVRLRF